jgi:hypothetical protein
MIQRTLLALGLLSCAALAFAADSERFDIPFAFRVQNRVTLPAGTYQVRHASGSNTAVLVNTETGQRVELMCPATTHQEGKTRLVFEEDEKGTLLRRIL